MAVRSFDPVDLLGIDHLELWVGNARAMAGFLSACFGFTVTGYRGPETGAPTDRASYLIEQGSILLVLTGAVRSSSDVAEQVCRHGDGVHEIAFGVRDVEGTLMQVLERGARLAQPATTTTDSDGSVTHAAIAVYGDTTHGFVGRNHYGGLFQPGFVPLSLPTIGPPLGPPVGLQYIDHVVANVERGVLDAWVGYYERVFGFTQLTHFNAEQIHTKYSALASTVMWNGRNVVLPINEPADGLRKSQITEFLEHYSGPGVQHVAMRTDDIVAAVTALRTRGLRFLSVPATYYDEARQRLGDIDLPWHDLEELGILVDRDEHGHLLQIFTEHLGDRPTLFFEIIQRDGAVGFGEGNFRALFEAIEREQQRRHNL
jgi:4-hydroxyphenylpyruvate dioxygenase